MNNTKFYNLLISAKDNPKAMNKIIVEIMPTINSKSTICKEFNDEIYSYIDEDLKSELIECLIRLVKTKNFANKLANENIDE